MFRRGLLDVVFPGRAPGAVAGGGVVPILYATGGAAAYRRERFLELGGFDPIYHPFYWEDADLGWRAWRRGWTNVQVPASEVEHRGGETIGMRFESRRVKETYERNRLLFMWSNVLDRGLWRAIALGNCYTMNTYFEGIGQVIAGADPEATIARIEAD